MPDKSIIKIVKIPKIYDDGYLCFAQFPDHVPFEIKRVYYITSPVAGLPRGKHAHKTLRQMLFCISGKVRMVLDNGDKKEAVILSEPENGIMLEPMVWHEMLDMDKKTILLVLASKEFEEEDYIRDYKKFKEIAGK